MLLVEKYLKRKVLSNILLEKVTVKAKIFILVKFLDCCDDSSPKIYFKIV